MTSSTSISTGGGAPSDVVVVEDHELVARALGDWINDQPGLRLAGWAGDAEAGLRLCLEVKPALVLLDICLPKGDGLDLAAKLRSRLPAARLVALTGQLDAYTIWRALRSGLQGFIHKGESLECLRDAVRAVREGKTYFSPAFHKIQSEWLASPDAFQKILSLREQEILRRVAAGELDDEIARALGISAATVHAHRRNIRYKLSLHNDRQMVAYARTWGLDGDQPGDPGTAPDAPSPEGG